MKGRRLGRVLTKLKKVTREQVQEALHLQKTRKEPLGQLLVGLGYITDTDVLEALAGQAGMRMVELKEDAIPNSAIEALPAETANTYQIIPLKFDSGTRHIVVAMKSPDNFRAVDDLRLLMGFKVEAVVAPCDQIDSVLKKRYGEQAPSMAAVMAELGDSDTLAALEGRGDSIDLEELAQAAEDNKIVRLLNLVLLQAIKDKASDIHFEPFESEFKMRYRIDGILYEMIPPPKHLALPIISRIKVMANLDIAERRLPQDGRIELTVRNSPVDLRVSVLPTMFGESVVLRVLDRSNIQLSLDKVGLRKDELEVMRSLIKKPNGIIIVTGPTGCGKTTTLYAALSELNEPTTKILTAEDPVEYDIDGLIQCQINTDQGLTFARLLRSFLRQDPDIILVGEIRDLETAQIAVQASLTGHLVFSTLHTNDAPSSILRLLDLGLESFLLTATVEAIVAQRLVRRICLNCKEEYVPTDEQLMELQLRRSDVEDRTLFRGRGCDKCNHSGYKGRMAIFEIMRLDDQLRQIILTQASTNVLRAEARKRGMRSLRDTGLMAIYEGQTTIDEVVRETIIEE
ncbi:MAG: Flp pilus assembly complex ATPase component TadA [Planctomycetes bacterium]|nr:Flp pilus assembly complex ATPase component TadA [Planctomycetota bacterium]MCH8210730.1 Flp pilus assembly complex ATPase component TadA [Planctomycetota bacterium]MCH8260120.1 Flp pilus assembly complex ATPase component TadA [Planctomycetota bacterium]